MTKSTNVELANFLRSSADSLEMMDLEDIPAAMRDAAQRLEEQIDMDAGAVDLQKRLRRQGDWMPWPVGLAIVRRAQYEALLAFYHAWGEYEVAAATGNNNQLELTSKSLAEKRQLVEAELRAPTFRVVSDSEIEQLALQASNGTSVYADVDDIFPAEKS